MNTNNITNLLKNGRRRTSNKTHHFHAKLPHIFPTSIIFLKTLYVLFSFFWNFLPFSAASSDISNFYLNNIVTNCFYHSTSQTLMLSLTMVYMKLEHCWSKLFFYIALNVHIMFSFNMMHRNVVSCSSI
jgi:hypothetical protein